MDGIIIDGTTYSIPFIVIGRKFEMLYKYAERTTSGVLKAEPIGLFANYDLQMGESIENTADYASLISAITDPTNWEREVTMPDGANSTNVFDAYFTNVSDDIEKWYLSGVAYYRKLTFSIIATSPTRTP